MEAFGYRDTLADILEFTGGRRLLTVEDVRQYTGLKHWKTITTRFPYFEDGKIVATVLARCLCGGGKR